MRKIFLLIILFAALSIPTTVNAAMSISDLNNIKSVTYWDTQVRLGCDDKFKQDLQAQIPGIKDAGFNAVWLVSWMDCFGTQTFPPMYDEHAFANVRDVLAMLKQNGLKAVLPLNYISNLPGTTVDFCSVLTYNQSGNNGYAALKDYVQKYLTEIQDYSNDTVIILHTEGVICDNYENPPVNVSARLRATMGRLPLDLPPGLRSQFTIGFHDFIFRWSEPGPLIAQYSPTPVPNPYDFYGFAWYVVSDSSTLNDMDNLQQYIDRLRSLYGSSFPFFNGELGADYCFYGPQQQANLTGRLVQAALSRRNGFNLWQWKGYPCGVDTFYINDPNGNALPSRVLIKNILTESPFVTSKTFGNLRNDFTGWVGMKFTTGPSPINIVSLGRIVAPSNSDKHVLRLVRASDGADVSGGSTLVTMAGGTVGQFQYASLPSTITLPANTAYYLLSQETAGTDQWYNYSNTQVTTNSIATVNGPTWSTDGSVWNFIDSHPNQMYVPLDLQYTNASPPIGPPAPPPPPPPPTGTSFVVSKTLGTQRNNFGGRVGTRFTVGTSPINVTALGRFVASGNTGTHSLKLVRVSDGTNVPGGAVSIATQGATAGQYKYVALSSPVILAANTAYYLTSLEYTNGDQWYDKNTAVTTTSVAADDGVVASFFAGVWVPTTMTNSMYGPLDFLYSPLADNTLTNATVLPQEKLPDPPPGTVWQLAFDDEFSGTTLDDAKWNVNGDYKHRTASNVFLRKANAFLNGQGQLVLRTAEDPSLPGFTVTNVDSNGKFTQKFGYIGARIKQSTGAFWMVSGDVLHVDNSGQDGSEIDIVDQWDTTFIAHGMNWDGYLKDAKHENFFNFIPNFSQNYHEVGINWQPSEYRFYVDGNQSWQSTAGGVSQEAGYFILGSPKSNPLPTPLPLPQDAIYDYVHAYDAVPKIPFTYTIGSPGAHTNYPDIGGELNNGRLGDKNFMNPEWVGVIGQSPFFFDIAINPSVTASQITLHTLRLAGPGIYLPVKIELWCSGAKNMMWNVTQPTDDGLYQIILSDLPNNCPQSTLRLQNGWWTFLSEITVKGVQLDSLSPTVFITSPSNNATILAPFYSKISGTVTITAAASDNVGIAGVQFKFNSTNIGAEDTSPPYSVILNSNQYSDGLYILSATARDLSGLTTSFLHVVINVSNSANLCSGVICNSPPPAFCSGTNKISYINPGTCNAGVCSYSNATTFCAFGCTNGQCNPDPCAGIICNSPPSSFCSGSNRISYNSTGTCNAGVCSYNTTSTICQFGCANGQCVNDPCNGVTCNNPPANFCSGNNSITYSNSGICNSGTCSYTTTATFCQHGCTNGTCNNDLCSGILCASPPANYCNGNILVTYNNSGTCNSGVCNYLPLSTTCIYGCANSSCLPANISVSQLLSWDVINATLAIIEPGIGTVDQSGLLNIIPENTLTYTPTAYNSYGSSATSATVHVLSNTTPQASNNQPEAVPHPAPFNPERPSLNINQQSTTEPITIRPPTHGWPDFGPQKFPVPEANIISSIAGHYSGEIENISAVSAGDKLIYYSVETGRDVTIFFFFHVRMRTYYYVEPTKLTIVKVEKPFWSFLAN